MNTEGVLLTLASVFVAVLVVSNGLGQLWFLVQLRRIDRRAWQRIASPSWVRVLGPVAVGYFQRGQHRTLHSAKLRRLGEWLRFLQLLAAGSFAVLVGYLVVASLRRS